MGQILEDRDLPSSANFEVKIAIVQPSCAKLGQSQDSPPKFSPFGSHMAHGTGQTSPLRQLKAASKPPPRFGRFDEVTTMRGTFFRLVEDVWEEDPEDIKDHRVLQVVLDIQHFGTLLLDGLGASHPDSKSITNEVGARPWPPAGL